MIRADDTSELREVQAPYGGESDLDSGNTFFWSQPSTTSAHSAHSASSGIASHRQAQDFQQAQGLRQVQDP